MIAPFLAAAFLLTSFSSPVEHFRLLEKSQIPKSFLRSVCGSEVKTSIFRDEDCVEDFNRDGAVWAGDVNGDGVDEFIVDPGSMPGTLGPPRSLMQQQGGKWMDLACLAVPELGDDCMPSWNTLRGRFDILPILRQGYHDVRIEVDRCLKWDGKHYIDYAPADYAKLQPAWFDRDDSHEAELFWKMLYADRKTFHFEPIWFTVSPKEFNRPTRSYMGLPIRTLEFPKLPCVSTDDPQFHLRWLSFFKQGVWGVRGNQAFLLVPQPSYLGAHHFELRGDWLLIYSEIFEPDGHPDIRYNRRTHELRFEAPPEEDSVLPR